jgi:hypothetical protein
MVILDIRAGVKPCGPDPPSFHGKDNDIWNLLVCCWSPDPNERIQMSEVVRHVEGVCALD